MKLTVSKTYDNWLTLLQELANGTLTLDYAQKVSLRQAASAWPTCACGQLCSTLPKRPGDGSPIDGELNILGRRFFLEIQDDSYTSALGTFKTIEKRSTYLVNRAAAAKAEVERKLAAAKAEAEAERKQAAAKAEAERKQAAAKAEAEAQAEIDRLMARAKRSAPPSLKSFSSPSGGDYPFNYNSRY